MKAVLVIFIGCLAIAMGTITFANCHHHHRYVVKKVVKKCDPNEASCQCTDPTCDRPWDSNCISRGECCEAFGNVGGR